MKMFIIAIKNENIFLIKLFLCLFIEWVTIVTELEKSKCRKYISSTNCKVLVIYRCKYL